MINYFESDRPRAHTYTRAGANISQYTPHRSSGLSLDLGRGKKLEDLGSPLLVCRSMVLDGFLIFTTCLLGSGKEREREKRVIEKFPGDQAFFSPSPLSCPIGKVRKAQFSSRENILDPACKEWVNFYIESASHNGSENSVTTYINIERIRNKRSRPSELL